MPAPTQVLQHAPGRLPEARWEELEAALAERKKNHREYEEYLRGVLVDAETFGLLQAETRSDWGPRDNGLDWPAVFD